MKIKNILESKNLPTSEIEIILAFYLKKDRSYIKSFSEKELTNSQQEKITDLISRRQSGEPIPYILGYREFYGRKFLVNKSVLIPRPETEKIIDIVKKLHSVKKALRIIDVGTGSGCIAITLAKELPELEIVASDISGVALDVAKKNAKLHNINTISFVQSNLLEDISGNFDVVVANLPYIPTKSWQNLTIEIKNFEPALALDSGNDKLNLYKKLAIQSKDKIVRNGVFIYEIDGDIIQLSAADDLAETLRG